VRAVLQRVTEARVEVDGQVTGSIALGFLVLLGVAAEDGEADADFLVRKISGLRVFPDEAGKMNISLKDAGGSVLAVSQFTLYGDTSRGMRPSFDRAATPGRARFLYEYFIENLRKTGINVETGIFQAMMNVYLCNHGPVTLVVESRPSK
jgi:D-tyrosyl-tRNA(Tyr) deacylase